MRWPWNRERVDYTGEHRLDEHEMESQGIERARQMRRESEDRSKRVDQLGHEVRRVTETAKKVREVNHLGPALERLFRGDSGEAGSTGKACSSS